MIYDTILAIAIFVTVWFTAINGSKLHYKQDISAINFIIWALSVTVIITHFVGIW